MKRLRIPQVIQIRRPTWQQGVHTLLAQLPAFARSAPLANQAHQ
jgi:hypothetical protein